jgi:mannose-6-phosphate isomerase-like protein (cupin superfamily)
MTYRVFDLDKVTPEPMENGRGEIRRLVNTALGTDKIDVHVNRLVPGGPRGKRHKHTNSDNVYVVLSGEGTLEIADETRTVKAGQIIYIGAGVEHSLSNLSDDIFEIVEIYTPSGDAFDFTLV